MRESNEGGSLTDKMKKMKQSTFNIGTQMMKPWFLLNMWKEHSYLWIGIQHPSESLFLLKIMDMKYSTPERA